jgi:hypothetical protein
MDFLSKKKLLEFMGNRKEGLYEEITRDFGGGLQGRVYSHNELKYWKEAIERGEFDGVDDDSEVYILMYQPGEVEEFYPAVVDHSFYISKESISKRVDELNRLLEISSGTDKGWYFYITLYSNLRNLDKNEVK